MILHLTEAGSGPPLCLLHGLFGRLQNLAPLARRLAGSFRVLSLDLRNHGASPHAAGMAYSDMAADVLETLAAASALPAAILGHSMGGKVAMRAALARPDEVSRLIVADIAPLAYQHHNRAITAALLALPLTLGLTRREADIALAASVPDPGIRAFLLQNLVFGAPSRWKVGLPEIAAGIGEIEGWPDLPAQLPNENPALFIRGGASDYVPDSAWPAICRYFPRARLETLAGAGHWLHADQPLAFGDLVAAALHGEQSDTIF